MAGLFESENFVAGQSCPVAEHLRHGLVLVLDPELKILDGDPFTQALNHGLEFSTLVLQSLCVGKSICAALDGPQQFLEFNRFQKIVVETEFDCRNKAFRFAVCRGGDDLGIIVKLPDPSHQLEAVHARHADVGHNDRVTLFFEPGKRLTAIDSSNHPGPVFGESIRNQKCRDSIIFNYKHIKTIQVYATCGCCHGSPSSLVHAGSYSLCVACRCRGNNFSKNVLPVPRMPGAPDYNRLSSPV